jgi:hypothetical protein
MTDLVAKYKGRTYRDIEWDLRANDMPEEIIGQTLTAVRAARAEATRLKLSRRKNDEAWGEVIEALQHERRVVRSMMRYKTTEPAPERDDFINQYATLLNSLYARLAKQRKEYKPPPHSHWVDFVPARVRQAFEEAASAIPTRAHAKVKQPFERRLPLVLYDRRKSRLLRNTRLQMHTALDKGETEKADTLKRAIACIHEIPLGEHIPNSWQEVMRSAEMV